MTVEQPEMPSSSLDPAVADTAPTDPQLVGYDHAHLGTYLRLLDAAAEGAAWEEATLVILRINATNEPERACRAHESHLARARWLSQHGYREFLKPPQS